MKKLLIILLLALSGLAAQAQTPPFQNYATNGTPYLSKVANYTIVAADFANNGDLVIYCDATTASFTITLPAVATMVATGRTYRLTVVKTDASANTVTISGTAVNINDATTYVISLKNNGALVTTNATQFYASAIVPTPASTGRTAVNVGANQTMVLLSDYLNTTATQYTLTLPTCGAFTTDGSKIITVLVTGTGGAKIAVPSGYAMQSGTNFATTTGTGGATLTQGQKVQLIPVGTNSYYLQILNGSVTLY